MESEIRFLHDLEHDLQRAADRQQERSVRTRNGAASRSRRWIPAVAAVLVLAWGVGMVAEDPGSMRAFISADEGASDGGSGGETEALGAPDRAREEPVPAAVPGVEQWDVGGDEGRSLAPDDGVGDTAGNGAGARGNDAAFGDLSKIVRTGRMRVKVDDGSFRDARDAAVTIAEEANGFVLDSRVEGRSGTFTIRVPAGRFDAVMTRFGRLGDVELEEQNGEDVTAEYVDLTARSEILTARRDVLLGLMEDATSLQQTLMLQNRYDEVQLELERITGQLRFLNDQVARSTIQLEIVERTAPQQRQEQVDNPSLFEAWKRGIQGFLNVVAVAIVGLGYLLPLLFVIGAWFGARELMRRRRRG